MQQIVDLNNHPEFQSLDVGLVSIAFDSPNEQKAEAQELGIVDVPLASDADGSISQAYDVLKWKVKTGEPGHTFILVDENGIVAWIRDYGAPENGGLMYVEPDELVAQIQANLAP